MSFGKYLLFSVFPLLLISGMCGKMMQLQRQVTLGGSNDVEALRNYLELVSRFRTVTSSSSDAGVAAVAYANELARSKGPDAAISYWNRVLPQVQDPAVVRAIRFTLVDLYRRQGKEQAALDQLTSLMTAPPTTQPTSMEK